MSAACLAGSSLASVMISLSILSAWRAAAASIACAMPTRQMFETEAFEKPMT